MLAILLIGLGALTIYMGVRGTYKNFLGIA
jgi:hypothetical protein